MADMTGWTPIAQTPAAQPSSDWIPIEGAQDTAKPKKKPGMMEYAGKRITQGALDIGDAFVGLAAGTGAAINRNVFGNEDAARIGEEYASNSHLKRASEKINKDIGASQSFIQGDNSLKAKYDKGELGAGDVGKAVADLVLTQAPQFLVGGVAGKVGTGMMKGVAMKNLAKQGVTLATKEAAETLAKNEAKNAVLGNFAGNMAAMSAQESGSIYNDQKPGEKNIAKAIALGIPAGMLEGVAQVHTMTRSGIGGLLDDAMKKEGRVGLKSLSKAGLKTVVEEGSTEGAQNVLEQAGQKKGWDILDDLKKTNLTEVGENMIGGAVMGGTMHGAGSAGQLTKQKFGDRADERFLDTVGAKTATADPATANLTAGIIVAGAQEEVAAKVEADKQAEQAKIQQEKEQTDPAALDDIKAKAKALDVSPEERQQVQQIYDDPLTSAKNKEKAGALLVKIGDIENTAASKEQKQAHDEQKRADKQADFEDKQNERIIDAQDEAKKKEIEAQIKLAELQQEDQHTTLEHEKEKLKDQTAEEKLAALKEERANTTGEGSGEAKKKLSKKIEQEEIKVQQEKLKTETAKAKSDIATQERAEHEHGEAFKDPETAKATIHAHIDSVMKAGKKAWTTFKEFASYMKGVFGRLADKYLLGAWNYVKRIEVKVDPNKLGMLGGNVSIGLKDQHKSLRASARKELASGNTSKERLDAIREAYNGEKNEKRKESLKQLGIQYKQHVDYFENQARELEEQNRQRKQEYFANKPSPVVPVSIEVHPEVQALREAYVNETDPLKQAKIKAKAIRLKKRLAANALKKDTSEVVKTHNKAKADAKEKKYERPHSVETRNELKKANEVQFINENYEGVDAHEALMEEVASKEKKAKLEKQDPSLAELVDDITDALADTSRPEDRDVKFKGKVNRSVNQDAADRMDAGDDKRNEDTGRRNSSKTEAIISNDNIARSVLTRADAVKHITNGDPESAAGLQAYINFKKSQTKKLEELSKLISMNRHLKEYGGIIDKLFSVVGGLGQHFEVGSAIMHIEQVAGKEVGKERISFAEMKELPNALFTLIDYANDKSVDKAKNIGELSATEQAVNVIMFMEGDYSASMAAARLHELRDEENPALLANEAMMTLVDRPTSKLADLIQKFWDNNDNKPNPKYVFNDEGEKIVGDDRSGISEAAKAKLGGDLRSGVVDGQFHKFESKREANLIKMIVSDTARFAELFFDKNANPRQVLKDEFGITVLENPTNPEQNVTSEFLENMKKVLGEIAHKMDVHGYEEGNVKSGLLPKMDGLKMVGYEGVAKTPEQKAQQKKYSDAVREARKEAHEAKQKKLEQDWEDFSKSEPLDEEQIKDLGARMIRQIESWRMGKGDSGKRMDKKSVDMLKHFEEALNKNLPEGARRVTTQDILKIMDMMRIKNTVAEASAVEQSITHELTYHYPDTLQFVKDREDLAMSAYPVTADGHPYLPLHITHNDETSTKVDAVKQAENNRTVNQLGMVWDEDPLQEKYDPTSPVSLINAVDNKSHDKERIVKPTNENKAKSGSLVYDPKSLLSKQDMIDVVQSGRHFMVDVVFEKEGGERYTQRITTEDLLKEITKENKTRSIAKEYSSGKPRPVIMTVYDVAVETTNKKGEKETTTYAWNQEQIAAFEERKTESQQIIGKEVSKKDVLADDYLDGDYLPTIMKMEMARENVPDVGPLQKDQHEKYWAIRNLMVERKQVIRRINSAQDAGNTELVSDLRKEQARIEEKLSYKITPIKVNLFHDKLATLVVMTPQRFSDIASSLKSDGFDSMSESYLYQLFKDSGYDVPVFHSRLNRILEQQTQAIVDAFNAKAGVIGVQSTQDVKPAKSDADVNAALSRGISAKNSLEKFYAKVCRFTPEQWKEFDAAKPPKNQDLKTKAESFETTPAYKMTQLEKDIAHGLSQEHGVSVGSFRNKIVQGFFEQIAKMFGAKLVVLRDFHGKVTGGYYPDTVHGPVIVVNTDSGFSFARVFAHELFHHMLNKISPMAYASFKEAVQLSVDKGKWNAAVDAIANKYRLERTTQLQTINSNERYGSPFAQKADREAGQGNLFSRTEEGGESSRNSMPQHSRVPGPDLQARVSFLNNKIDELKKEMKAELKAKERAKLKAEIEKREAMVEAMLNEVNMPKQGNNIQKEVVSVVGHERNTGKIRTVEAPEELHDERGKRMLEVYDDNKVENAEQELYSELFSHAFMQDAFWEHMSSNLESSRLATQLMVGLLKHTVSITKFLGGIQKDSRGLKEIKELVTDWDGTTWDTGDQYSVTEGHRDPDNLKELDPQFRKQGTGGFQSARVPVGTRPMGGIYTALSQVMSEALMSKTLNNQDIKHFTTAEAKNAVLNATWRKIVTPGTKNYKDVMTNIENVLNAIIDWIADHKPAGVFEDFRKNRDIVNMMQRLNHAGNLQRQLAMQRIVDKFRPAFDDMSDEDFAHMHDMMARKKDAAYYNSLPEKQREAFKAMKKFLGEKGGIHDQLKKLGIVPAHHEFNTNGQVIRWMSKKDVAIEDSLDTILRPDHSQLTRNPKFLKDKGVDFWGKNTPSTMDIAEKYDLKFKDINPLTMFAKYVEDAQRLIVMKEIMNEGMQKGYVKHFKGKDMVAVDDAVARQINAFDQSGTKVVIRNADGDVVKNADGQELHFPTTQEARDYITANPALVGEGATAEAIAIEENTDNRTRTHYNVQKEKFVPGREENIPGTWEKDGEANSFDTQEEADAFKAKQADDTEESRTVVEPQFAQAKTQTETQLYFHKDMAAMLNVLLSEDRLRRGEAFGISGEQLMNFKNTMTMLELTLSAFHAMTIGAEMISSYAGWHAQKGGILKGLMNINPLKAYKESKRINELMKKAMDDPEYMDTAAAKAEAKALFGTDNVNIIDIYEKFFGHGGMVHQDESLRSGMQSWGHIRYTSKGDGEYVGVMDTAKGIADSFHETLEGLRKNDPGGNIMPFSKAMIHHTMVGSTAWLMEEGIPKIKFASFAREYALKLDKNADKLAAGLVTKDDLANDTMKFIEDRFGEVNWKNMWLNKSNKTALQFMFRSFTWFAGSWKALAKSGIDMAKLGWFTAKGEKYEMTEKGYWGMMAVATHIATVAALSIPYALAAAGGDEQETDEDTPWLTRLLFPRVDPYDNTKRITVPSYVSEAYKILMHLGMNGNKVDIPKLITGRFNSVVGNAVDLLKNEDFKGVLIRNPEDGMIGQVASMVKHVIPIPISIGSAFKAYENEGFKADAVAWGLLGATDAPSGAKRSVAANLAFEESRREYKGKETTEEEMEMKQELKRAMNKWATGDKSAVDELIADGKVSKKQLDNAITRYPILNNEPNAKYKDQLSQALSRLTVKGALKVYQVMTDSEKEKHTKEIQKKINNAFLKKEASPAELARLKERWEELQTDN